jgi:glycosyltransferase involved in cell wall biosynthesis
MKITFFTSLERNFSIDRYTQELSENFPSYVTTHVVRPEMSDGLRGKIYDRYIRYLAVAKRESGDYNIVTTEGYGFLLAVLPSDRTIVVCHDVHPLLTQHWTGTYRFRYKLSLRMMSMARRVVAISHSTRNDLLSHCRYIADDKVAVIHNGLAGKWSRVADESVVSKFRRERGLEESPIILHVGNDNWYKNFAGVLRAFAVLAHPTARLVKVGEMGSENEALAKQLGISERIIQFQDQTDEELRLFYSCADIMVFPSLHEGFGWPPLEAMACGCPVVASNSASLPEVCGDAAILVNPTDAREMVTAIRRLLEDASLRRDCIRKGLLQSRRFRWRDTATGMLELLGIGATG